MRTCTYTHKGEQMRIEQKVPTKSRRFSGLMRPSTHERLTAEAAKLGLSLNEVVTQLVEHWIKTLDAQRASSNEA